MSKKIWGSACWYLFHTLAYKLNPTRTDLIKPILIAIKNVCANLPCPDCSEHSIYLLSSLREDEVKTKDDLIKVLWIFHNKINSRLGTKQFSMEESNKLYEQSNIQNIFMHFNKVMRYKISSSRMMLYDMGKRNSINNLNKLILSNKTAFIN